MQEASENVRTNTQNVKFMDMLIAQWLKRSGNDGLPYQTEEMAESSSAKENTLQQSLQKRERIIHDLKRKLKESQEAAAFLSASLETETRNKEEIQIKLSVTWETIDTITEYFNYISESLTSFQQHRITLSATYDNIIVKQQEAIQKLQQSNAKSKALVDNITQLKNTSLLQEEKLQEALKEQNKLRMQLENSEYKLQLQKNELNSYIKEKMTFAKEQQNLISENENLKSELETIKEEKCDLAKSAAHFESKFLLQDEKLQNALAEQDKLQKQMENIEREFYSQKTKLATTHAEEKKMLVKEQQQLLSELETLQSRINMLERDKNNITEVVAQKDELLSNLQDEVSTYKNQIEMMKANNNETHTKCEALEEKQNMWEKESRAKTERIQNLETILNAMKQRESKFINDINRIEKKLTNGTNYAKDLENKLSNAQEALQFAEKQNADMQKALENTKSASGRSNTELQQQLKILQREKEECVKRESAKVKTAEMLYENLQAKHADEISAMKIKYETQLMESQSTVDSLNERIINVEKDNTALNISLTKMRTENSILKNKNKLITESNENIQTELKETTKALQIKSIEDQKSNKIKFSNTQPNKIYSDSSYMDNSDDENDKPPSPIFPYSQNSKESPKEQEAEVTSAGRKFFKMRSTQPRTYSKRRQYNL